MCEVDVTMLKLIDLLNIMSICGLIILLGQGLFHALGGSIVFIVIIPLLYYFSYVEKLAQVEVSLLNILILFIIGINYINYIFKFGLFSDNIVIVCYFSLYISIIFIIYNLTTRSLNTIYYGINNNPVCIIRQNYKFIILTNLMLSLFYAGLTCLVILSFDKKKRSIRYFF